MSSERAERTEVTHNLHDALQSGTQRDASPVVCSLRQSFEKAHSDTALLLRTRCITARLPCAPPTHSPATPQAQSRGPGRASVLGTKHRTPAWLRKLESEATYFTVNAVHAGENQILLAHY